jgi:phosphatidylethanolamine-binding protein (PEBP) family uncharacterized protein
MFRTEWLLATVLSLSACASAERGDAATKPGADADVLDATPLPSDAAPVDASSADASTVALTLTSKAFVDGGTLPTAYTCDGSGTSPPLAWSGTPPGAAELALLMTTEARDGRKWNWVLHSIPTAKGAIDEGSKEVGVAGLTSDGPLLQYYPPCSQGPGAKSYTFTLYALRSKPALPSAPNQVTGAVLEAAIAGITIAKASITVTYTRP